MMAFLEPTKVRRGIAGAIVASGALGVLMFKLFRTSIQLQPSWLSDVLPSLITALIFPVIILTSSRRISRMDFLSFAGFGAIAQIGYEFFQLGQGNRVFDIRDIAAVIVATIASTLLCLLLFRVKREA